MKLKVGEYYRGTGNIAMIVVRIIKVSKNMITYK